MESLIELFGWLGAAIVVLAYFFQSLEIVPARKWLPLLNFWGAGGILVCSVYRENYQPAVVNGIWMAIAVVAMWRRWRATR